MIKNKLPAIGLTPMVGSFLLIEKSYLLFALLEQPLHQQLLIDIPSASRCLPGGIIHHLAAQDLVGRVALYDDLIRILTQIAPVPVRYDVITTGAKGYYDLVQKEIVINSDMSELQTVKTLIHETAHAMLHDNNYIKEEISRKSREQKETEAESVAYTVCAALGLDTGDYSFPFLHNYSGTPMIPFAASSHAWM